MMVKQFAVRLVTEGIDCYEVRPGMMATSMTASSKEKYDGLIAAGFVPAHRWGELTDIGDTVANLADGALRYAVGQTIHVDGGMPLKTF
jgi:NAD(P)-dependent dehydrogenase (short-subunit alcohol dehydrogenase family)